MNLAVIMHYIFYILKILYFQVVVENSSNIETVNDLSNQCEFWLSIVDSHAKSITDNLIDITVLNSKVDMISTEGELRDIDIENSNVGEIHSLSWIGYEGTFRSSHIERITNLKISDRLKVNNSTINVISSNGVEVSTEAYLTNMTIHLIKRDAININNGNLVIKNAVIDSADSHAFNIDSSGRLELTNVTINEGTLAFINKNKTGSVVLTNVTLGGHELEWTVSIRYKDLSLNTESAEVSSSTRSSTNSEDADTINTESTSTKGENSNTESIIQKESTYDPPNGMKGAFFGFLLGVVAGVVVFGIIKFIR